MAIFEKIGAAEDGTPIVDGGAVAALNAVALTLAQLTGARDALGRLAAELRWDQAARRELLHIDLGYDEATSAAIDARLLALRKWEDLHDPNRLFDRRHLMDAAALAKLCAADHGIGFDDETFGELVEFVQELPW